jgi:hypothetical protein
MGNLVDLNLFKPTSPTFANNIGENATLLLLPEHGIFGNGHVVMIERNSLRVADLIIG